MVPVMPVQRLRQVMLDSGVKERQVRSTMAKICGITPQSVHQWFDGRTKAPSAEHLAQIAAAYGVNLMWVVTGKGDKYAATPNSSEEALALEILRSLPENLRMIALAQLEALKSTSQ